MNEEEKYLHLQMLVEQMPRLVEAGRPNNLPRKTHQWLGRLEAVIESSENKQVIAALEKSIRGLMGSLESSRREAAHEIQSILFKALARAELSAPGIAKGTFIAVGNAYDAIRAISDLIKSAKSELFIIDPYMDETVLSDVVILASENLDIRLLSDIATVRPTLKPMIAAWRRQYGPSRPVDARLAPARSLHDRLILVDQTYVWVLTQSLKDLAKRSPATLTMLDPQTAELKLQAYDDIWKGSSCL
ncbi:MAG: hypothetical protein JO276_10100 [Sphingomonadaceae bacterium]|nr:hypothetical protein [Sphingomonadaceae bacterium]